MGEKESVLPKNPCSTLSMRFNLCDYTNLSNLANPLFFITVFLIFFSVIYFEFPFLVLCFRFEFCDSVLSFVFLFWVL